MCCGRKSNRSSRKGRSRLKKAKIPVKVVKNDTIKPSSEQLHLPKDM